MEFTSNISSPTAIHLIKKLKKIKKRGVVKIMHEEEEKNQEQHDPWNTCHGCNTNTNKYLIQIEIDIYNTITLDNIYDDYGSNTLLLCLKCFKKTKLAKEFTKFDNEMKGSNFNKTIEKLINKKKS